MDIARPWAKTEPEAYSMAETRLVVGRGVHSSTCLLNLSRFCH